ncbi:hypothetical protein ACQP3D_30720, partial [Escherichia coli]
MNEPSETEQYLNKYYTVRKYEKQSSTETCKPGPEFISNASLRALHRLSWIAVSDRTVGEVFAAQALG